MLLGFLPPPVISFDHPQRSSTTHPSCYLQKCFQICDKNSYFLENRKKKIIVYWRWRTTCPKLSPICIRSSSETIIAFSLTKRVTWLSLEELASATEGPWEDVEAETTERKANVCFVLTITFRNFIALGSWYRSVGLFDCSLKKSLKRWKF